MKFTFTSIAFIVCFVLPLSLTVPIPNQNGLQSLQAREPIGYEKHAVKFRTRPRQDISKYYNGELSKTGPLARFHQDLAWDNKPPGAESAEIKMAFHASPKDPNAHITVEYKDKDKKVIPDAEGHLYHHILPTSPLPSIAKDFQASETKRLDEKANAAAKKKAEGNVGGKNK